MDIFLGSSPNWTSFKGFFSMYFRVFSLGKYTESGYFFGLQKFQIFLGHLKFLIFFGG